MDNAKLQELVGDVLQDGLAEIAYKQPGDAVDYLGRYLLKYVAIQEEAQEKVAVSPNACVLRPPGTRIGVGARTKSKRAQMRKLLKYHIA